MIAHLGMYDLPDLRSANDQFWTAIRDHLGYGPAALTRDDDVWRIWRSPDLLFSQTCGMPFRTKLHSDVQLIGTPDYGLEGLPAGHYTSVIVARKDSQGETLGDFAGQRFAYNEALSQSGWAAPMRHAAQAGVSFADHIATGGHAASAQAVSEGRADIAGIDALTWVFLTRHTSAAERLRVLEQTPATPTLPYITSLSQTPAQIAKAIRSAIADLAPEVCNTLHLKGLVDIPKADYLAVTSPPPPTAHA